MLKFYCPYQQLAVVVLPKWKEAEQSRDGRRRTIERTPFSARNVRSISTFTASSCPPDRKLLRITLVHFEELHPRFQSQWKGRHNSKGRGINYSWRLSAAVACFQSPCLSRYDSQHDYIFYEHYFVHLSNAKDYRLWALLGCIRHKMHTHLRHMQRPYGQTQNRLLIQTVTQPQMLKFLFFLNSYFINTDSSGQVFFCCKLVDCNSPAL